MIGLSSDKAKRTSQDIPTRKSKEKISPKAHSKAFGDILLFLKGEKAGLLSVKAAGSSSGDNPV